MIEYFQEDGQGDLFVANGIGKVMRWDGFAAAFEEVGMDAPGTALTIGGTGSGSIVGTYYAFERFVDAKGNVSDLSPVSNEYAAVGTTGTITAATNASPISVTSASHGLITGATVKITGVGGNTSANDTWPITVVDANTFTLDDSHGTADYDGGGTWTSGVLSLSFTGVPIPSEAKVVRRQILRNTDGQATTFYVDVDTEDLVATTFSSTRSDSSLATQEAVPLLDSERNVFANRHAKPLTYFPFLASHLDRMFLAGSVEYTEGNIKVTNGSATVYGVGTEWKSTMADRFLYITGSTSVYEIESVSELNQTLTLTENYTGITDKFCFYAIKPPSAYERTVAFAEAGLPQSWLATNGVEIQDSGDKITGMATQGAFVYILEARHLHKLTFSVGPLTDGGVFMVASRGCVNQRCCIVTDDALYMIDELGAYRFSQRQVEPLSQQVQSIFRPASDAEVRINWRRKEFFHASLDRQQEVIRWFVCLDGSRYPKHAICLQYRSNRWWVEPHPMQIGGSCSGDMVGLPQVFYAASHAKILAAWTGHLDLVDAEVCDVRGTVTSATAFTLSDSTALFSAAVNAPVAIVEGKGKGQVRKIVEVSATELMVSSPFLTIPDTTSVYQIGGVHWKYRSGWMRYAKGDVNQDRRLEISFEPMTEDAVAMLRIVHDTTENYDVQAQTVSAAAGGGIASIKGEPDLSIDLTFEPGIVQQYIPGNREHSIRGRRYVQFEMEGHSNIEPIRWYQFIFEGVLADTGIPQGQ